MFARFSPRLLIKRFYGKKRGSRNMRSDIVGGASLGLMFSVFFFGGLIGLAVAIISRTAPDFRANYGFREASCQVLGKRIVVSDPDSVSTISGQVTYEPQILVSMELEGQRHETWTHRMPPLVLKSRQRAEQVLARYEVSGQYPCWYDIYNPQAIVLERGHDHTAWLILVLPISFIMIGGGGMLYTLLNWGKSVEHRAVLANRAGRLSPFEDAETPPQAFPNVPDSQAIMDSPGTHLAYRLPAADPGWGLWGLGAVALFWNGVVSILLLLVVTRHRDGEPDWWLTLLVVAFAIVGIGLLGMFVRRFIMVSGAGPTILEVDHRALVPGQRCEVFLQQAGRLDIRSLRVRLVCEEEAHYQQGTNRRSEVASVVDVEVFRQRATVVRRGSPLEARFEFTLDEQAMHSFIAPRNRIRWLLRVEADMARWPGFVRNYVIHVYPARTPA